MKRYQSPLFLAKLCQFQHFRLRIIQCNGTTLCREGPRVNEIANCVYGRHSLGVRHYTNGFQGVDRISPNLDDFHFNGRIEVSETNADFRQQGNSRSGANYIQNGERFQQRSTPQNHITVTVETNVQNRSHDYVDRTVQRNTSYSGSRYSTSTQPVNGQWSTPQNRNAVTVETNAQNRSHDYVDRTVQQNSSYSGSRHGTGTQPFNGHWSQNSSPYQQYDNHSFTLNAATQHKGGHQRENVGFQPSLNSYQPSNMVVASDNNTDELTLEGFDALCKEWNLERAVESMNELSGRGFFIDLPRYLFLIEACGKAKAVVEAKAVLEHLLKHFSPINTSIYNKILDMCGKCGLMNDAYEIFNNMPERNLTTWDTMISWYAKNGLGEEAIDMFTNFKESGLKPDGQMFLGLFDACGVVGDVTEGMLHFESMSKIYGITPTMDHYARIVHMFGSAGDLDGALEFIEDMPVEPSVVVWESLMSISRVQGNVDLGDRCAQIVEQLDPSRLTKESKSGLLPVEDTLTQKVKKASLSGDRHQYRAGDRSHPEQEKIYTLLRGFKESLKEAGYIPETRYVLHDISPEEKEESIMAHSERLAAAYSLFTSSPRSPIRIIKNIRVCGDCHNVFKILSKLVGRMFTMRDQKRWHHFSDGKCSCNDYW